ncbi:SPOR domain-containing protein [Tenacibaculum tangerinum]|uniref:SPOR domain-containing protein n=1 Tax=Tenacibaculum tangerinum TaxID=3038772 RepID=A0ABY8L7T5_9FLAO|nr:SPOR domain-containing protein [Tenacibaculum tangerinum]WGH76169.1 SPOR domain-containing protein [Tenacibaculum tangerinum]
MPFIEEEKFKLMQQDLDNAKLKREVAESELSSAQEKLAAVKRNSKVLPMVLGILLGLALGATYYFYTNGSSSVNDIDIEKVKKEEAFRVIDSISRAEARAMRNNSNSSDIDVDTVTDELTENIEGKTIYSVQIGVLSENNYPLLSSEVIPSTVTANNGYFKYSLGLFSTIEEAKDLQKELVKLGFKDAFVASYVNGERQKIHN